MPKLFRDNPKVPSTRGGDHKKDKEYFKEGAQTVFPFIQNAPSNVRNKLLNALWKDVRCGLYHNSRTCRVEVIDLLGNRVEAEVGLRFLWRPIPLEHWSPAVFGYAGRTELYCEVLHADRTPAHTNAYTSYHAGSDRIVFPGARLCRCCGCSGGITVSDPAICHPIWTLQSETGRDTGLISGPPSLGELWHHAPGRGCNRAVAQAAVDHSQRRQIHPFHYSHRMLSTMQPFGAVFVFLGTLLRMWLGVCDGVLQSAD